MFTTFDKEPDPMPPIARRRRIGAMDWRVLVLPAVAGFVVVLAFSWNQVVSGSLEAAARKDCEMAVVQDRMFPGHFLTIDDLKLRDRCGLLKGR